MCKREKKKIYLVVKMNFSSFTLGITMHLYARLHGLDLVTCLDLLNLLILLTRRLIILLAQTINPTWTCIYIYLGDCFFFVLKMKKDIYAR